MDDNHTLFQRFQATAATHVSNYVLLARLTALTALGDALFATPEGRDILEQATRAPNPSTTRLAAARVVENWDVGIAEAAYSDMASSVGRVPRRPTNVAQAYLYQPLGDPDAFTSAMRLSILDGSGVPSFEDPGPTRPAPR